ncbi:nicotinate-nucleotide adenylyltransferase [Robertkochia aurantiaca]|uniref:nicotinate-nucleotide adenylyltransferase n=1 Tax=Robertkochia aurantiaca TaxID=2873700 RepID=UPI001CCA0DD6|nr:nicotinate-nucleotide adenylyltransferase [Robertkochia sp. 3YJGBD-33]
MKKIIMVLLILGLTSPIVAQDVVELSAVEVSAMNYKYLKDVGSAEAAVPVRLLEEKVARYDLKSSDIYSDEYETYTVNFFIPDGKVVAAYDKDGNLVRTIEKFKNVSLPNPSRKALLERFPGWEMTENIYRVTYHTKKGVGRKDYSVKLVNGDQVLRVKVDDQGNFM